MRILIVEDEVLIAWMLADSPEGAGHEVVGPAATLGEALALCEAAPPPELAVLDINLRDGSNGVEVARALMERWGVRSIFASSDEMLEARRARSIALGCIRKPYRPETVLRSVEVAREVMDGRTPGQVPAGLDPRAWNCSHHSGRIALVPCSGTRKRATALRRGKRVKRPQPR